MAKLPQESGKQSGRIVGRRYRYTEDYQTAPALGENGRGKRVFYVGPWILPRIAPELYKKTVLRVWLLTALVVAAVAAGLAVLPTPMTHKWYVPILVFGLFPLSYQVMGAVMIPPEIKHMERQRYDKSIVRAGQSAIFTFAVICASALGCAIYWLVAALGTVEDEAPYALADGVFAALLVLAALAELAVRRLIGRIEVDTLDHDAYRP